MLWRFQCLILIAGAVRPALHGQEPPVPPGPVPVPPVPPVTEEQGQDQEEMQSSTTSPEGMGSILTLDDPELVRFGPGERPMQGMEMFNTDNGVIIVNVHPDNDNFSDSFRSFGELVAIEGEDEEPTRISTATKKESIERAWAKEIRRNKVYHLRIHSWHDDYGHAFFISAATGIVPTLVGLFVSIFLFPCFVAGLCGKFALSCDAEKSEKKDSESPEQKTSNQSAATDIAERPIPRLKQSWFTYILGAKTTAVSLVAFSMSSLLITCFGLYSMRKVVIEDPIFAMIDLSIPTAQLALCLSVVIGIKAAKTCEILAEGATAPEELLDAMHRDLRWSVLLPFAPQAVMQVFIFSFVMVVLPGFIAYMMFKLLHISGPMDLYDSMIPRELFQSWPKMLGVETLREMMDMVCHRTLLFFLMLKFMLDAFIAARVVVSRVNAVSRRLENPLNLAELKEVHSSCVQLARGSLKDLSVISPPTFAIALLNWLYAFLVAFQTLLFGGSKFHLVGTLICHIPIGLSCLLLPATVSDACIQLTRNLNEQRSDPDKYDIHKQLTMTEKFIAQVNDGQGIGFVLYGPGMVVNKRVIFTGAAKIAGVASIVLPTATKLFHQQRTSHALLFGNQTSS